MSTATIAAAPTRQRRSRSDRAHSHRRPLARYTQPDGLAREIVLLPAAQSSRLLIDRLAAGLGDGRLLAHLDAEEPDANAQIVCRMYLADSDRACCRIREQDFAPTPPHEPPARCEEVERELRDSAGRVYRIRVLAHPRRRLRWTRLREGDGPDRLAVVSLREVVGALQDYEPARAMTRRAIEACRRGISTDALRRELDGLSRTPVVLNRALREAVTAAVDRGAVSMSEIAIRCGRAKRDRNGRISGDVSWISRRIGLRPDRATAAPSPWVHVEVLALIAREGLGIAPADVEVE
jgi:hypothetical protein